MTFKKAVAVGTILANMVVPLCAKNYEAGLETEIENKYHVDLIGDFQKKEVKNIDEVMKTIDSMIDRKENGIEEITLANVDAHDERLRDGDGYASATVADGSIIYMSTAAIYGKAFDKNPLADYKGLLAHEIGHLIYEHLDKEKIFSDFIEFNWKRDLKKESAVPDGYVTAHPLERDFIWVRDNEDVADDFSYIINKKHYADKDPVVQKKMNAVKGYLKMRGK